MLLAVSDDGIGIQGNVDFSEKSGMGVNLVKLMAKQVRGEITCENDNGFACRILIPTLDRIFPAK